MMMCVYGVGVGGGGTEAGDCFTCADQFWWVGGRAKKGGGGG